MKHDVERDTIHCMNYKNIQRKNEFLTLKKLSCKLEKRFVVFFLESLASLF